MSTGQYYSAGSASALPVLCYIENNSLTIRQQADESVLSRHNREQLNVASRLGQLPREIKLPDDALLVVEANESLHHWLDAETGGIIAGIESKKRWMWGSLVLVPLCLYLLFGWLMPWLAVQAADQVPFSVKQIASEQTLNALEFGVLSPSKLSDEQTTGVYHGFGEIMAQLNLPGEKFNIKIRNSDVLGPNAFALPDGTIVFTDQLLELVDFQQPLLNAILLHEIGHVEHNHSMQMVAESLFATLTISYLFGDISGAIEAFMGIGSSVVQNQFSQAHEWQADDFALQTLVAMGRPPQDFAEAMRKLQELLPDEDSKLKNWFSSHPMVKARIENAEEFTGQ